MTVVQCINLIRDSKRTLSIFSTALKSVLNVIMKFSKLIDFNYSFIGIEMGSHCSFRVPNHTVFICAEMMRTHTR